MSSSEQLQAVLADEVSRYESVDLFEQVRERLGDHAHASLIFCLAALNELEERLTVEAQKSKSFGSW